MNLLAVKFPIQALAPPRLGQPRFELSQAESPKGRSFTNAPLKPFRLRPPSLIPMPGIIGYFWLWHWASPFGFCEPPGLGGKIQSRTARFPIAPPVFGVRSKPRVSSLRLVMAKFL